MARLTLGNLAVAGSKALSGLGRGRVAGRRIAADDAAQRRRQDSDDARLALALSEAGRGASERANLDNFLRNQPEGEDLTGLPQGAATGIYSGRLAARRARQPSPSEQRTADRQEESDAYSTARAVAEWQASTNRAAWKPETLAAYLIARFVKLNHDRLRQIAVEALAKTVAPLDINALKARLPQ